MEKAVPLRDHCPLFSLQETPMQSTSPFAGSRSLIRSAIIFGLLVVLLTLVAVASSERSGMTLQTQQREAVQRVQDYQIGIAGYKFDPLRGEPYLPENVKISPQPGRTAYYIIQFTKSLTRAERERVKHDYGLRLTEYIPNLSYLEKVNPQTIEALKKEASYRASVFYQPAFKISPTIGKLKFRTPERRALSGLLLRAILFSDANENAVLSDLRNSGAKQIKLLDDRKVRGATRVMFLIPSQDSLPQIARIEGVRWIEEVPEINNDNVNTAGTIQSGTAGTTPIWDQGLHGENQIIGMIDGGPLDINHCYFMDAVNNTPRLDHRKVLAIRNASGTAAAGHATFVAGNAAGDDFNNPGTANRRGSAWASRLVSGNNTDLSGGLSTMLAELDAASVLGGMIHTNSWHDDTAGAGNPATYNQTAADVDTFVWNNEDHLVLGSAGNNGEEQGPPGTAKDAICVGASQADPTEMNFGDGNSGPTADGRRKPDMMTPGCGIQSATVGTACTTGPRSACATSYATPHTAGAAALVRQYFTEGWYPSGTRQAHNAFIPSGALLKATLLNSTIDMTGPAGYPSNQEGWGLIRLNNTLFFPGSARNLRVWDTHNSDGLNTGDSRTQNINVATNAEPLRVTLVWSDAPGAAGAAAPVVNDLDLVVTSPDGTQTFLGNQFAAGVSTTGGAADALNNVEMVLVNNPAPGAWTITVNGTAVNVGNPGQGYALVATADTTEPPVPTGNQDTLVVRVKYADIATTPSLPNLQNLINNDVVNYFNEVTYNKATVLPEYRGPIVLDHEKGFYTNSSRNLLIEMTEEVVAKLVAADANVFTKGTPDPNDDIDRMILVGNDEDFSQDWATTGPWPYDMPGGFTRPLSVSIQSYVDNLARFAHGLGHQFNLVDLYAHPGVTFSRPAYADEWDNMAKPFRSVHYLTWEKERAGWINTPVNQTVYVPRPAAGGSYTGTNPIPLFFQESNVANTKAIAIGLTNGAATLANEDVFYFVEARNKVAGSLDNDLPSSGALIYFVNERIPQGQGPVILLDKTPGTDALDDAAFQVGDSRTIPGTGITITVQAGSAGSAFNIQLAYTPINTDHNVRITAGDTLNGRFYAYFSPDIWVDSPRNGLGNLAGGPPPPTDPIENPVIGMVNNICARVFNDGPNTAFDFDVRFRISEPAHTVGGELDFDELVAIRRIAGLVPAGLPVPAGMVASPAIVCVPWTPVDDGDSHSCVWVDFINLVGTDTNQFDNSAQENLETATSVTSSPFHPVTYPYELTNPYPQPALFYFRAEGAPPGWSVVLNPKKILLNPGQRVAATATITPPPDAQVCTSQVIQVSSWTPRGDTLINVGGGVVQVDLRKNTLLTLDTRVESCNKNDRPSRAHVFRFLAGPQTVQSARFCERVVARGCTNPALPNQLIIVKYVMPDGTPIYHEVMTDATGCYEDFVVSTTGGDWKVTAEYEGDKCQGPVTAGPRKWNCCKPIR
jgi:M6 family metalloprotease-like protein